MFTRDVLPWDDADTIITAELAAAINALIPAMGAAHREPSADELESIRASVVNALLALRPGASIASAIFAFSSRDLLLAPLAGWPISAYLSSGGHSIVLEGRILGRRPSSTHVVEFDLLVHQEDLGDRLYHEGQIAGGPAGERRVEGFLLKILPSEADLDVQYMVHIENEGDRPFQPGGTFAGTRGERRRMEGFAIKMIGSEAENYSIQYQAYVEGRGWTPVRRDCEYCGTRGESLRIEAMIVRIVRIASFV